MRSQVMLCDEDDVSSEDATVTTTRSRNACSWSRSEVVEDRKFTLVMQLAFLHGSAATCRPCIVRPRHRSAAVNAPANARPSLLTRASQKHSNNNTAVGAEDKPQVPVSRYLFALPRVTVNRSHLLLMKVQYLPMTLRADAGPF